jgi:hypothetical protein
MSFLFNVGGTIYLQVVGPLVMSPPSFRVSGVEGERGIGCKWNEWLDIERLE